VIDFVYLTKNQPYDFVTWKSILLIVFSGGSIIGLVAVLVAVSKQNYS